MLLPNYLKYAEAIFPFWRVVFFLLLHWDLGLTAVQQELQTRGKTHHDKQPQFITYQRRNRELNRHLRTNPEFFFGRSQRGGTITAWALCGLAYTFASLFVRMPVWSHTSAHILPQQRGHLGDLRSHVTSPPSSMPSPSSLILPSHQRRGGCRSWRLLCQMGWVQIAPPPAPLHFCSRLHPAAQTDSVIYTR